MSIHLLILPDDKDRRLDLVSFANQLARVAEGVTITPTLRIVTPDDTLDILLHRLGAKRQAETPTFPAPETASAAEIPGCSNCGRQVRPNKHGLCMKCQRARNRNGDDGAAAAKLADELLQDDGHGEPAAEITGQPHKNKPADTRTDARFSEPTVFVEDREQNKRILTRQQQPIRGRKLG